MGYNNLKPVSELQYKIMRFVDYWTHTNDDPIPQKIIIKEMIARGTKRYTTINALNKLLKRGYIRRGVVRSNSTYYVQVKRV